MYVNMPEDTGMNRLPRFLEGQPLPEGYFNPPDPYKDSPPCPYYLSRLVAYAKEKGVPVTELTWEEVEQFRTDKPR
jgi:hypothetical protein